MSNFFDDDHRTVQSVCPFVGLGTPPPRPRASLSPPLGPKGGRSNTPFRVRGVGGPNSDDWKESLALCVGYVYLEGSADLSADLSQV